ncbi:MAG TPA: hypothetical protein VEV20_02640 [Burkholderiales bacterium]|nr:hypothetical protein [Burkholderiales bacterium]
MAAFILVLVSAAAAAGEDGKKLIWGNIPLVKAGNYYEFDAELSRTRATARGEALDELAALLIPLASSSDDVARLAGVVATTIMEFDNLVRRHADQVHQGIPISLAEDFRSGLDRFYMERRLTDREQRTGFAYVSRDDLQSMSRQATSVNEALQFVRDLRYLAYGSYTVLDRGQVRVVLHLEDLMTSRVHSFGADGPVGEVGELLAVKVMDFLQGVEYPSWQNPQPQLIWIAPASPETKVRAQLAARYCEGQKARLPYASELLQAAMAGNYREGGIGPLLDHATYIVADRNLHDEQYYYTTGEEAQLQTGGPLHTSAGHGTIIGYYWCVRGEPSKDALFDQAIYRLIRQSQQQHRASVVSALEYVLAQRNDLGLESVQRGTGTNAGDGSFPSLEGAVQFLAQNGVFLQLPVN